MFGRIDHIGVAVADLEAAIDLHVGAYGMELVHRETIAEQGVEAVLLDVGENHVELLAPLGDESPVARFLAKRGPGLHHVAYQVEDIDAALRTLRGQGVRMIDEAASHRHPRLARGLPAPGGRRRRADRARRAGEGGRRHEPRSQPASPRAAARSASTAARCCRCGCPTSSSTRCGRALREGRERWHEVEAADGAVLVDLGQVVYLRVESDEHRIGF